MTHATSPASFQLQSSSCIMILNLFLVKVGCGFNTDRNCCAVGELAYIVKLSKICLLKLWLINRFLSLGRICRHKTKSRRLLLVCSTCAGEQAKPRAASIHHHRSSSALLNRFQNAVTLQKYGSITKPWEGAALNARVLGGCFGCFGCFRCF